MAPKGSFASTDTGVNLSASYTYENDLLTKIQTASTTYNFTYGNFGLRSSVKVGTQALATYSYTQDGNNYLSSLDYGNGDKVQYEYDHLGRVTKQTYEDGDTVTYQYDNSGALATVEDSATGRKTTYYYDFTDRLMKYVETGTNYYHSVGYEYDQLNNLTSLVETINGTDYTTSYAYDDDNRVMSVTTNGTTVEYTYDAYGRVSTQVTKRGDTTILTETYTYVGTDTTTSGQIATYKTETANYSVTYSYTYDDNGNIVRIEDNHGDIDYQYDSANQLIREDNDILEYTHVWAYDNAGNIQTRTEYSYLPSSLTDETPTDTVTYLYGDSDWGDLLTTYDGQAITYDTIGNPLNDGTRTYTWEHGRELSSLTQNNVTWNYTYDLGGLRTSRTNGTKTYNYIYSGSQLVQMSVDGCTYDFTCDASGTPLTVSFNGGTYYYVTNVQGDVVSILNSAGEPVVQYFYDAWGNILSTGGTLASSLGATNPLRYRGYVYDQETALYYLQSRYYDPTLGRFLNADGLVSTGQGLLGYNMFAYCGNNPPGFKDSSGTARIHCTVIIKDDWGYTPTHPTPEDTLENDTSPQPSKFVKLVSSFFSNIEASAGIGLGLYGEIDFEIASAGLGNNYNLVELNLSDGHLSVQQSYSEGLSGTFWVAPWQSPHSSSSTRGLPNTLESNNWVDSSSQSWVIFSKAAYLCIGGSIYLGFDMISFCEEIDEIFFSNGKE